jgi:hypothetical protein
VAIYTATSQIFVMRVEVDYREEKMETDSGRFGIDKRQDTAVAARPGANYILSGNPARQVSLSWSVHLSCSPEEFLTTTIYVLHRKGLVIPCTEEEPSYLKLSSTVQKGPRESQTQEI